MVDPNHTKSLRKKEDPFRDACEVAGVPEHSYEALLPCTHGEGAHLRGIFVEMPTLERIQ
jgi:hypothetical protein